MTVHNLVTRISDISRSFDTARMDDGPTLAKLAAQFDALAGEKPEDCSPILAGAAAAAAGLVRKINDQTADKAADLETISRTLTLMQRIAAGEDESLWPAFPAGLGYQPPEAPERDSDQGRPVMNGASGIAGDPEGEATNTYPVLLEDFIAEAREHIEAMDNHLLTLEKEPTNKEALNAVFRAFHSVRGAAGFLNLEYIGNLAQEAETLLGGVQRGEQQLTGVRIDVILDATDMMKHLVEDLGTVSSDGQTPAIPSELPNLVHAIAAATRGEDEKVKRPARVRPYVKRLGEILVDSGILNEHDLAVALAEQAADPTSDKLGNYLVRQDIVKAKDVAQALRLQRGELLDRHPEPVIQFDMPVESEPQSAEWQADQPAGDSWHCLETVAVDAEQLDLLVDAIGRLAIVESMVTHDPEVIDGASDRLRSNLRHLSRISRELQEMGTVLHSESRHATE